MHLGLLNLSDPLWTAGQTFTGLLANVLGSAPDVRVTLLTDGQKTGVPGVASINLETMVPSQQLVDKIRRRLGYARPFNQLEEAVRQNEIDVVLPAFDSMPGIPAAVVAWIPDFQHHHAGDFFSADDIRWRNDVAGRVGRDCNRVLFSSQDAESTFQNLYPQYANRSAAIPFPSSLAVSGVSGPADEATRKKYHIPEKFVFVPNQFWKHKNHSAVVHALRILRDQGINVHCVFTGLPYDSRDPQNGYLSRVLQQICEENLTGSISVLGFISRKELIDLFRTAALVIQPSLSEGWSTSVQDALALGKPLICSDLPVHREQAPESLGFFEGNDPAALADLLAKRWPDLQAGPDSAAEEVGIARERKRLKRYRDSMVRLCTEAMESYRACSKG
jgi:glycosyltransferase involved in cell wall biosynthesis